MPPAPTFPSLLYLTVGRRLLLLFGICALLLGQPRPALAAEDGLDPLYARIAADLARGKPLVVTVIVALCDNSTIWCGYKGFGDGDQPRRNLYWGGAAGFRAYFDRARGYRRIYLDGGDGEEVLERVVYRRRVAHPPARWRRWGVKSEFEVLLVGLAFRGRHIARATETFIRQVATEQGSTLKLPGGRSITIGGSSHLLGYAGHNYLLDVPPYPFPAVTRKTPLSYFSLSCLSGHYLARPFCASPARALLVTLSLMYPGAFTIDGLVQGVAAARTEHEVNGQGVSFYARYQKSTVKRIGRVFIHQESRRFTRLAPACHAQ